MDIIITPGSVPLYQQIFDQISAQILSGELPGDTCLSPIRTFAQELRVSVITVKRAWEELERAGFIYTVVGRGCFVSPHPPQELSRQRDQLAREQLAKDLEYYRGLGLSLEELQAFVEELYE